MSVIVMKASMPGTNVGVCVMCYRMEEHHAAQVKAFTSEAEDQRSQITQMEKQINDLQNELEAIVCTPGITMKYVVEQLKRQVMEKDKEIKVVVLFCVFV